MATSRREKGALFEAYYAATDLPPAVVIAFTLSSLTIAVHDSAFSEPSIWEIFDHLLHPSHGHSHHSRGISFCPQHNYHALSGNCLTYISSYYIPQAKIGNNLRHLLVNIPIFSEHIGQPYLQLNRMGDCENTPQFTCRPSKRSGDGKDFSRHLKGIHKRTRRRNSAIYLRTVEPTLSCTCSAKWPRFDRPRSFCSKLLFFLTYISTRYCEGSMCTLYFICDKI